MQQILKKEKKKSPKQEKFMKCKIFLFIFAFCVKIPLKNPQTTYTKEEKKKKS